MPYKQSYKPNIYASAQRGWCLKFIDDAGNVKNTLPPRTRNARTALNNESKRLKTSLPPVGIWVVGFLDLRAGQWAADDHVFLMKYLGNGKYEIRDSETNSNVRSPYVSIDAILAWFGAYKPKYVGWSTHCDGRQYAEWYEDKPIKAARKPAKGTAKVLVDVLNVRNAATNESKIVAQYKKGQTFNYDSYTINDGFVWLSYVSASGVRRYVAEGPNDGKENTVYVSGGV